MRKVIQMAGCECECGFGVQVMLRDDTSEFHLCMNCLISLVNLNLTKEQYRALIEIGHDRTEHLLHDDFYDDEGNALQPRGR